MRVLRPAPAALVLVLAMSPPAAAAGGPVAGGDAGGVGTTVPSHGLRYVAIVDGDRTIVQRIHKTTGRVWQWRGIEGQHVVGTVAQDLSTAGLSGDAGTLVLSTPRRSSNPDRTRFQILDARSLRTSETITLRGDFTLDAVSPDGDTLYLVEYVSADRLKYVVRAYDVERGRLLREPVVDPARLDLPMRGMPIARAESPDARWAYTLYDGAGEHPFVHALDTEEARALCVVLQPLEGRDDVFMMRLDTERDGTVTLRGEVGPELQIDPESFEVSAPRAAAGEDSDRDGATAATAGAPSGTGGGGASPLLVAAGLALALALAAALTLTLRRTRDAQPG